MIVFDLATKNMSRWPDCKRSGGVFHRNKKYAYFLEARRIDKDGYMSSCEKCDSIEEIDKNMALAQGNK